MPEYFPGTCTRTCISISIQPCMKYMCVHKTTYCRPAIMPVLIQYSEYYAMANIHMGVYITYIVYAAIRACFNCIILCAYIHCVIIVDQHLFYTCVNMCTYTCTRIS